MAFTTAAESAVPKSIAGGIEPTAEATSHGYRLGLNPLGGGRVASAPLHIGSGLGPRWLPIPTPQAAEFCASLRGTSTTMATPISP